MAPKKPVGWRMEPVRHGLAAKGIKTAQVKQPRGNSQKKEIVVEGDMYYDDGYGYNGYVHVQIRSYKSETGPRRRKYLFDGEWSQSDIEKQTEKLVGWFEDSGMTGDDDIADLMEGEIDLDEWIADRRQKDKTFSGIEAWDKMASLRYFEMLRTQHDYLDDQSLRDLLAYEAGSDGLEVVEGEEYLP